jgi:hypothetical protein
MGEQAQYELVSAARLTAWLEPDDGTGIRWVSAQPDGSYQTGQVVQGINGRWFRIGMSQVAHAYPLGGLDNLRHTGFRTPQEAAASWLEDVAREEAARGA